MSSGNADDIKDQLVTNRRKMLRYEAGMDQLSSRDPAEYLVAETDFKNALSRERRLFADLDACSSQGESSPCIRPHYLEFKKTDSCSVFLCNQGCIAA